MIRPGLSFKYCIISYTFPSIFKHLFAILDDKKHWPSLASASLHEKSFS